MLLLSEKDIKKVFTMKEAIEADKVAFKLVVEDKAQAPIRTNIQAPKYDGSFLFMPAYVEDMDLASLKIVNIFPRNIEKGKPTAPAQVLLIDGTTGEIIAILDGTYVTKLRTGAASGVAFDILSKNDCKIGALIGTGSQAEAQLEAMVNVRDLDEVRVYDLNYERTVDFVEKMRKELSEFRTKIIAVKISDEAVDNADLLITVTPSTKPVFDGNKIKKGATVSCVGAYQHHMQEMDPVLLTRASKIYFDSKEAVLSESGDILIPLEKGIISEKDFTGEIGDVILGNVISRENDDEIIVFETVGVATQDLVVANEIYKKALKANVGKIWE
ncbi:ornithine cyclodeaminase [Peptostreptococcus russellii]|uniref:Ornithine cyclodeaminase n=1 Tax=Peptostreptococcus russellii TaxID=215200 RepID=A0A2P7Q014_9FIRM|nr:ornithine cyclodeaminase family protein [Peptostreptococcus russellii]PSJ31272.1 ornithine cyclodeaminase [Peptostreptococcus russellii]